ncbi:DUF6318 family protein [Micrococcus sp.]|uniref:DUF6318 family protein n=1 Tax=Micrococcus sp. TaxID=1271 RepID=UPI0026DCDEEA|nr:DUF6318 family protein [Micrococcus sp.]MDO4240899.1 DUF6318 family protein [Micrococcus sp.]
MTTLPTPRRTLRRHRLARTSTWGAALLLALTACGADSPDPDTSPSAPSASVAPDSATASTSEAGTPTASAAEGTASRSTDDDGTYVPASEKGPARNVPKPVMPEAVKEDTPEGAEAAVKHWWDAVYYLQQTNDPEPLKSISDMDNCDLCNGYIKSMASVYEKGGWYTGSNPQVHSAIATPVENFMDVTVLVNESEAQGFTESGGPAAGSFTKGSEKQPWRFAVSRDAKRDHWVISISEYAGQKSP